MSQAEVKKKQKEFLSILRANGGQWVFALETVGVSQEDYDIWLEDKQFKGKVRRAIEKSVQQVKASLFKNAVEGNVRSAEKYIEMVEKDLFDLKVKRKSSQAAAEYETNNLRANMDIENVEKLLDEMGWPNDKQQKACEFLAEGEKPVAAIKKAGYAEKTANQGMAFFTKNKKIQLYYSYLTLKISKEEKVDTNWILSQLKILYEASPMDYFDVQNGRFVLKEKSKITPQALAALESVSMTDKGGVSFKVPDKLSTLKMMLEIVNPKLGKKELIEGNVTNTINILSIQKNLKGKSPEELKGILETIKLLKTANNQE